MENNIYKSNIFYSYMDNQKHPKKKLSWLSKLIIYLILLSLIITSFVIVKFQIAPLGLEVVLQRISEAFSFSNHLSDYPNYSLIDLSIQYLWISIKGVIIGTSIGFVLAFITSTLSNQYLIKSNIVANLLNVFIVLLRALPTIIFIYIFTNSYSKNIALIMVLGWFSWIWLHKYMREFYLTLNYYPYQVYLNQGNSILNSFLKTIVPQINNKFTSLFLYSLDSNVRWSSILGTLGLAGIGELILKASNYQFESMGIPVVTIMVFMIFLETIIYLLNRFLFVHKSFLFNKDLNAFVNKKDYKSIIKIILFLSFIILLIVSISTTDWKTYSQNTNIFEQLFYPNWQIINTKEDLNLAYDIFFLFTQTIVIMTLALVISLLLIFISCYKLFKSYSLVGIFISTIIRATPMIAIFFIINPLFTSPSSSICIIFGISTATIMSKNVSETINKLDDKIINHFVAMGYSKIKIFFKYILPSVKNNYFSLFTFEWENQFRDLITYGTYGVSAIGSYISLYFEKLKRFNDMATFVWIAFFIILFVIFINFLIKRFILDNKNLFIEFDEFKQKVKQVKDKIYLKTTNGLFVLKRWSRV